MLWLLLLLSSQRVRLTGLTAVAVRCESCRRKYHYRLKRTVRAEAMSREQARRRAKQLLLRKLDCDIDPVPCPSCGCYQEEMLPLLLRPRLRWMQNLAIAGFALSLFCCVPVFLYFDPSTRQANKPPLPLVIAGGAAAVLGGFSSITLLGLRGYLNARYDPNDPETEEERIDFGRSRSLTREEARELLDFVIRRE
jgi:hypothetical protein